MFLYYFTYARVPFNQVVDRMAESDSGWIAAVLGKALEDEDLVKIRLAAGQRVHAAKEAWLQLGVLQQTSSGSVIPIRMQGSGVPELFPTLEGEIEIAPMGEELTQITLKGSYHPPLGPVGRIIDKVALHRVAEASIKRFLDELAAAIEKVPGLQTA